MLADDYETYGITDFIHLIVVEILDVKRYASLNVCWGDDNFDIFK